MGNFFESRVHLALLFDTFNFVNLCQIIWIYQLNLARNTHNPQAMAEYRGQGLFLNLKLDPSPVCLKELKRNKLTIHCTWIYHKDSLHFSFVSFTEKRKVANNCPFYSIYCAYIIAGRESLSHFRSRVIPPDCNGWCLTK